MFNPLDYSDPIWFTDIDKYIVLVKLNGKYILEEGFNIQTKGSILRVTINDTIYRFGYVELPICFYISFGVIDLTQFNLISVQPIALTKYDY